MSHDTFQESLLDLAYGELSPRQARKVEAHASQCASCRSELERIRETRRLASALGEERAPERGEAVLLAAAREATRAKESTRRLPGWIWSASVVAVSLVAVAAVSYQIIAMRPGPLGRDDHDALLGSPQVPAAAPEPAEPAAAGDGAAPEPRAPAADKGPAFGSSQAPSPRPGSGEARRGGEAFGSSPAPPPPPGPGEVRGGDAFGSSPPSPRRSRGEGRGEGPPPAAPRRKAAAEAQREAPVPVERPERQPAPERREVAAPPAAAPAPPPAVSTTAPRSGADADEERAASAKAYERSAPAAPSTALSAPAAKRARADSAGAGERRPPVDAVERYHALRAQGRLQGELRTFPRCAGEAWRKVERDPEGRVVAYVREGMVGGTRLRIEAIYGPDGRLARARALPQEGGEAPPAEPLVPLTAAQAADEPPRCGE
jgi:hypothetical protein